MFQKRTFVLGAVDLYVGFLPVNVKKNICVQKSQMCPKRTFLSENHKCVKVHLCPKRTECNNITIVKNHKLRYIIYPLLMYIIK